MTIEKKRYKKSIEMLRKFGLTSNEALIYAFLLENGAEVGGSKISVSTSLHRQYVYTSLKKLIELGLVETVVHGKRKKYLAITPSEIEKIAKRRVIEAEDIVKELNTFSTVGHEQDFEVVQGERAIQKFEIYRTREAKVGTMQYFIGGGSENFVRVMGEAYNEYATLTKVKKIGSQYIGAEHELGLAKFFDAKQKMFDFRIMNGLPKSLVNVMIMDGTLSFYTYANPPILYVVKSKLIAESYKKFFDMLWVMAQKPTVL
mgnify:CR=1 FL=1